MKKNGKRPNRFVRFLAIICAAALVIQLVPADGPMSLIAQATESSGVDDKGTPNNDTTTNETTDNDTTKNDTTTNETTDNDTTKNDTTTNDTTNNDTTNNDTTTNDTTNNDTTNNDTTNNDTANNDTTKNDTTKNDTTNNDTTNNDTTNSNTTNNDTTNNDTTNNDTTKNDTTNNDTTNNDTTTNDTDNNENNESEQEESKLAIKNGSDEVTGSVEIKSSEVTLTADGLSGNYTYTWALDNNSTVKNAVKLTSSGNKVKLSSVKGKQGGEIKLTVTAKKKGPQGSSDSKSKSVTLKVYTEYGVGGITLKKSEAGDTNKEKLGDDDSAEITDTLYAEPVYTDGAIDDDKDDTKYSYQWVKKDANKEYQNIEGATDLSYTPDAAGTYKLLMTRTPGEDSYRVSLKMESAEITVKKIQITAKVTVPGKNFDNTENIPEDSSKFSIEWSLKNINERDDVKLLLNGKDLASSYSTDLQYDSVGSVTENTEVGVKATKDSPVYTMESSDAAESFEKYEVIVTFEKATINAVVKNFDDVASVAETPVTYKDDEGTIWVPANKDGNGTIAFNAKNGYTIGAAYKKIDKETDPFADKTTVTFKKGSVVAFYAKNADGEIAKITMENVKVDSAAPTVIVDNIKKLSNVELTETIVVDDTEAGVAGVYYMITVNEENVKFDEKTWTSIDLNKREFTITVPNYGYVYIHSIDKVGNAKTDIKHSVIYENAAPSVSITCDNADGWKTSKAIGSIKVTAADPAIGSGIQSIEVYLYKGEKAEGTPEKNAFRSNSTHFSNDRFKWEFDFDNLSDAELLKKAQDEAFLKKTGEFSFSNELNGVYTLKVTATDNCGNTIEDKDAFTKTFKIDNSAPEVKIDLNDTKGSAVGKNWYYGASSNGMTITFTDNCMIDEVGAYLKDSKGKQIETKSTESNKDEVMFSAGDIKELTEGEITVFVKAKDAAENEATSATLSTYPAVLKLNNSDNNKVEDDYWKAASFILDKTNPEVVSIETTGDQGKQDYPITDNHIYADTGSVYYNKDVDVKIEVEDNYFGKDSPNIKGSLLRDLKEVNDCIQLEKSNTNNKGFIATYSLKADEDEGASYSNLTISGTDYAGNPLKLKSDYKYLKNDSGKSPDELVEGANGSVIANYGKVIDKKSPEVTITYTSDDQPNMYTGETSVKDRVSAYYNKPVSVSMQFKDNYELDGNKLYAGAEGSETQQTSASGTSYNVPVIKITQEGRSVYTAYGTDRALNPTTVTESAPDYDKKATSKTYADNKTAVSFDKNLKKLTPFVAAYEIVLDQTAPAFTLAVESPSSKNKSINSQGNRYYFNNKYTATFTVQDTNYDASKIMVKKGSITSGSYNSETANVSEFPTTITSKSRIFKETVDSDGVYRYAIYGSDKAGNALVPSSDKNLQTTSDSTNLVVDEKSNGSLETEANISNHIVVDTVKPVGELEIKTGKTTIYKMDTKGNVTYAEPYRKETNASFKITVDSNVEKSPVSIAYKVTSTRSSDKKNVSNSIYKYNNSASGKQTGKQIFQVTQYRFTDLAGNITTYAAENKIYLDKDLPNIDKIAPTISIVAKAKSGTNGYRNGQPLFRSDVPLNIVVSDPDSTNSSSGLADVTYQMYVAGKLVSGDTKALHKANTKTYKKNYKDEKLVYKISPTVTVGGKSHNNNDLEVVVTAYDNAGNKREMKYNFGIDVTSPTVQVTYDNNSAQNQKYFKANRTATIAVTERNFDPSKFKINTQSAASISGWSHTSKGGNGDKDVWTAHVTYSRDGNYTLEVSGEDLLGNKATDIKYNGTAPREFTVDKTFPSISVTYNNNDVRNGKYYKASRTATISVSDVNFNGQNDIVVKADGGGRAPSVRFNGKTATLRFPEDGIYIFNGTVTDMAGNQREIPKQTEFVIDTKPPVLIFEDGKPFKVNKATEAGKSDHPVDMQFFTEDGFAPVVTVVDTNISTAQADAIFEIIGQKLANHFTGKVVLDANDNTKFTMGVSSLTFKVSESIDDVYHVKVQAIDLAGNESELIEFDFSINRFGSSYAADRDDKNDAVSPYSTYGYIRDSYYHNSTQDLTIFEYNTNALKKDSQKVEMMKDGNTATIKTLTPGTDYTFEEVPNTGTKLRTYRYKISSSVFEEEGDYSFTISSIDEAGHKNTTSRVHKGTDENGKEKLYVDSFPIDFVIDKTAPTNQLAGVKSSTKQTVNDKSLIVDVYPEDAQTAVAKVEIRRWMGDTLGLSTPDATQDPVQTITYAYYDQETNPKPADTDTQKYEDLAIYTDESTDQIKINYEITDNKNWQWVEVITTDLAGNESTDIRAGSQDGTKGVSYSENRRGFLVTTNTFSQVVNNMAARVGAGAAIVLILLFLILRKRKKDQANAA